MLGTQGQNAAYSSTWRFNAAAKKAVTFLDAEISSFFPKRRF